MSDRIDELEDAVNKMTFTMADTWFDGSDVDASARFAAKDAVMETVTELATIAREAEARALKAEADSVEWVDRCYQSDERALKAEAMCEWLAEALIDSGWCRPDGERENAPCQEDGETCRECAIKAASEEVKS